MDCCKDWNLSTIPPDILFSEIQSGPSAKVEKPPRFPSRLRTRYGSRAEPQDPYAQLQAYAVSCSAQAATTFHDRCNRFRNSAHPSVSDTPTILARCGTTAAAFYSRESRLTDGAKRYSATRKKMKKSRNRFSCH